MTQQQLIDILRAIAVNADQQGKTINNLCKTVTQQQEEIKELRERLERQERGFDFNEPEEFREPWEEDWRDK